MSDAFFAEPRVVEVGGKQIQVKPLRAKYLSKAARLAEPVMLAIAEGGKEKGINFVRVMQQTDDVIALCSVATFSPENCDGKLEAWQEWIGELDLAELLKLATAVIEVNADFFIRRLLPAAQEAMQSVSAKVGQASLSGLDAPASP